MSNQRRERQDQYFHPRNPSAYWREAVQREMDKMEQVHPGIFSATVQRVMVSE
jgi:hypothetical protein